MPGEYAVVNERQRVGADGRNRSTSASRRAARDGRGDL